MPGRSHTMPEDDEEVRNQVEAPFGVHPCLWQICVICAVLAGDNVITIAPTGLGKSLTYWMTLLYILLKVITMMLVCCEIHSESESQ